MARTAAALTTTAALVGPPAFAAAIAAAAPLERNLSLDYRAPLTAPAVAAASAAPASGPVTINIAPPPAPMRPRSPAWCAPSSSAPNARRRRAPARACPIDRSLKETRP